ncbi:DinB family protein [Niabella yanshanensis]|uniref:DinB family protein n=1 Tax=Niabella yanshanensis TaxID=577386 RepID=A0ABZ0W455_9BACT|nr:DinB family protein [Niabella yanshanensis]WQD38060.1 DinB family protein [Niabella yanshanensis]
MKQDKEVWLRGALIEGITPLLQPVAHALLQASEELTIIMQNFNDALLWTQPAGCASPGFHLLHISGVLDRLLTYAEGNMLTDNQLAYLKKETEIQDLSSSNLEDQCQRQIKITLDRLKNFIPDTLTHYRSVGRAALPSTVIGLCTHAAEHTMRHIGQLIVTVKILQHQPLS